MKLALAQMLIEGGEADENLIRAEAILSVVVPSAFSA